MTPWRLSGEPELTVTGLIKTLPALTARVAGAGEVISDLRARVRRVRQPSQFYGRRVGRDAQRPKCLRRGGRRSAASGETMHLHHVMIMVDDD